jgi:high-affinity nickel-transport protein
MNLTGALSHINQVAHRHEHDAATDANVTPHWHGRGALRPLTIGVVHGLAGSAAIALLVLATIKSAGMALLYLAIFGAGTVVGMMLLTGLMAVPISAFSERFRGAELGLARVTGGLSLAFGLFLAYRIGITSGLFVGTPSWTPH